MRGGMHNFGRGLGGEEVVMTIAAPPVAFLAGCGYAVERGRAPVRGRRVAVVQDGPDDDPQEGVDAPTGPAHRCSSRHGRGSVATLATLCTDDNKDKSWCVSLREAGPAVGRT